MRNSISALLAVIVLLLAVPAFAQEEMAKTEELTSIDDLTSMEKRAYDYNVRGRRDPFVSLIRDPEDIRRETGNPLLDNDISQMTVIAIVWDAEQKFALFGLPDGKYYTIREGQEIGLHGGHVEEILADVVMIREQKPDFKGKLRPVDTYIRLRKEEGQ